ncbi:hypothetical protein DXG01_017112, partial [Tephrocybe rancida]
NDGKRKPLIYKYHPEVFQGDMPPPAQPAPIPQSLVPLTPSTSLPAGLSADIGPAWNPSSRTPDSRLQFLAPYLIRYSQPATLTWTIGALT